METGKLPPTDSFGTGERGPPGPLVVGSRPETNNKQSRNARIDALAKSAITEAELAASVKSPMKKPATARRLSPKLLIQIKDVTWDSAATIANHLEFSAPPLMALLVHAAGGSPCVQASLLALGPRARYAR